MIAPFWLVQTTEQPDEANMEVTPDLGSHNESDKLIHQVTIKVPVMKNTRAIKAGGAPEERHQGPRPGGDHSHGSAYEAPTSENFGVDKPLVFTRWHQPCFSEAYVQHNMQYF